MSSVYAVLSDSVTSDRAESVNDALAILSQRVALNPLALKKSGIETEATCDTENEAV
jgi:hypothetical protein